MIINGIYGVYIYKRISNGEILVLMPRIRWEYDATNGTLALIKARYNKMVMVRRSYHVISLVNHPIWL